MFHSDSWLEMRSPRFGDSVFGRAIETREQKRGPRTTRWRAVKVNFRDSDSGVDAAMGVAVRGLEANRKSLFDYEDLKKAKDNVEISDDLGFGIVFMVRV